MLAFLTKGTKSTRFYLLVHDLCMVTDVINLV